MKLNKRGKIALFIITILISIIMYIILGFLGAYADKMVVGNIFILFGWIWLLFGQIIAIFLIWRN